MSELYGRIDDSDALYGQIEEVVKVISDAEWGLIGGDIEDQTDLQNALDLKADKTDLDTTNRKLEILSKLAQGQIWDYDEVDETVYQQTVPAGGHGVEMESVGGRSVVWNQLVTNGNFADESGWSVDNATLSVENSVCEISYSTVWGEARQPIQVKSGHKYYISLLAKKPFAETVGFGLGDGANVSTEGVYIVIPQSSDFSRVSKIGTFTDKGSDTNRVLIKCMGTIPSDSMFVKSVVVIDLTLLGMSDITSTSDPRIAWIEAYAEEHPEYNAGEVIHGKVEKIEEEGKNIIDLSDIKTFSNWKTDIATTASATNGVVTDTNNKGYLLPCLPNVTYTISKPTSYTNYYLYLCKVDSNKVGTRIAYLTSDRNVNNTYTFSIATGEKAFLRSGYTTDKGTFENRFGTIEWIQLERGSTATTYSPCHKTTYPIPAEVQALDGYGWGINAVSNTVGFKSKKYTQKIKAVDMGTLSWSYNSNGYFETRDLDPLAVRSDSRKNLLALGFVPLTGTELWTHRGAGENKYYICAGGNTTVSNVTRAIYGTLTDATAFKAAMSGVMLYYELATPIETDISAYIDDSWQAIPTEPNGSITFQNDNLLPVPVKDQFYVSLAEAI